MGGVRRSVPRLQEEHLKQMSAGSSAVPKVCRGAATLNYTRRGVCVCVVLVGLKAVLLIHPSSSEDDGDLLGIQAKLQLIGSAAAFSPRKHTAGGGSSTAFIYWSFSHEVRAESLNIEPMSY